MDANMMNRICDSNYAANLAMATLLVGRKNPNIDSRRCAGVVGLIVRDFPRTGTWNDFVSYASGAFKVKHRVSREHKIKNP